METPNHVPAKLPNGKINPEYSRQWRQKNLEKARASQASWRQKNPEKARASRANWGQKNPERVRAIRARHTARVKAKEGGVDKNQVKCIECGAVAERESAMLGWRFHKQRGSNRGVCPDCF